MDNEQAAMAVQPEEAAPVAGAENERENTMNALLDAMAHPQTEPDAEQDADAAAVPSQEPEAEVPALADDETQADAEAEEEEEAPRRAKNFRGRWDHLDDAERRVVELTTRKGLTLSEAYRAVYGEAEAEAPPTPAEPTPEHGVAEVDAEIAAQQAELETLKSRKGEAKGDLAAYDEAAEAYYEARERLRELEHRRERLTQEASEASRLARDEAARTAQAALESEYPEALTPGSDFYDACREELAYLRESGSPLAQDPQVEYKVARRLARTLGLHRAPAALPEAAPAVAAKRHFRPLPTGGMPIDPPAATLERRVAGARSPDAMLDLMRELGTPFEALLPKA